MNKNSFDHWSDKLNQINENCPGQRERLQTLAGTDFALYPVKTFLVRAPGRVNLIGEHTDYNGYPVMPMAINRDILAMARPYNDPVFEICNTNPRFGDRLFTIEQAGEPYPHGDWGNYAKAAITGLLPYLRKDTNRIRGFSARFSGNIPPAAGLSSSSAMVVASALTFLHANETSMPSLQLAEILARAEKFVGTEGGGMDQTISLMGQAGKTMKIDFYPLRVTPVRLPLGYEVVICNSLIRAPKTESVRANFNMRALECRLAAFFMARQIEKTTGQILRVERLADLDKAKPVIDKSRFHPILMEPKVMDVQELCSLSGSSAEEIKAWLGRKDDLPAGGFKIGMRYQHITSEAARVESASQAMRDNHVEELGDLMYASHASCRDDYEISVPELDALVEIASGLGAVGSRLTGAGFGGCTVNLVAHERISTFIEGMRKRYYRGFLPSHRPDVEIPDFEGEYMFATPAVQGACLL